MHVENRRHPGAIWVAVAAMLSGFFATNANAATAHKLDGYVEAAMKAWEIPGLAVAVVQDGKVVFARGYGIRQAGRPERVDENTSFGIGSVTKSFTATAAAMLVDDGKLAWDAPIIDYIPSLQFNDPWITAHATVRDLAAHRLGIDGFLAYFVIGGDLDETVRKTRYIPAKAPFRSFLYSNTGYALLGKTIENASGGTWDQFITQRILEPLGMRNSYSSEYAFIDRAHLARCWLCVVPPGTPVGIDAIKNPRSNVAVPHGLVEARGSNGNTSLELEVLPWREDRSVVSTGMIHSSVRDMAQYMLLHLSNGEFQGKRLISAAQIQQLHSAQVLIPATDARYSSDDSKNFGYGMGWMIGTYRGTAFVNHGGGRVGYGADVLLFPEKGLGIVVLQNLDFQAGFAAQPIARRFADYYLGAQTSKEIERRALERPTGWKPVSARHPLCQNAERGSSAGSSARLVGTYRSDLLGEVKVAGDGERLTITFEPQSVADLVPAAHESFAACFRGYQQSPFPGQPPFPVRFTYSAAGEVTGFVLGEGEPGISNENAPLIYQPVYFKRVR